MIFNVILTYKVEIFLVSFFFFSLYPLGSGSGSGSIWTFFGSRIRIRIIIDADSQHWWVYGCWLTWKLYSGSVGSSSPLVPSCWLQTPNWHYLPVRPENKTAPVIKCWFSLRNRFFKSVQRMDLFTSRFLIPVLYRKLTDLLYKATKISHKVMHHLVTSLVWTTIGMLSNTPVDTGDILYHR